MPISGDAGFLFDTNVIQEVPRRQPHVKVVHWLASADEERSFLSVATIAEIGSGIASLPVGTTQKRLRPWPHDKFIPRFDARILPANAALAIGCGSTVGRSRQSDHQIEAMDALIAATAEHHNQTIVTRNRVDFACCHRRCSILGCRFGCWPDKKRSRLFRGVDRVICPQ